MEGLDSVMRGVESVMRGVESGWGFRECNDRGLESVMRGVETLYIEYVVHRICGPYSNIIIYFHLHNE